jgi:hypothetical protein
MHVPWRNMGILWYCLGFYTPWDVLHDSSMPDLCERGSKLSLMLSFGYKVKINQSFFNDRTKIGEVLADLNYSPI